MEHFQITDTVLIVAIICITIITITLLLKSKKVKVDKSGIDLELSHKTPETEEINNETDIV